MPTRPLLAVLAAAALASGCTTLNDRFYVPGSDLTLTFLGAEYAATSSAWPPATLPYLPPMRTALIPDRAGPPFVWVEEPWSTWWHWDRPVDWPPL
jgi:hypothetical protein